MGANIVKILQNIQNFAKKLQFGLFTRKLLWFYFGKPVCASCFFSLFRVYLFHIVYILVLSCYYFKYS